MANSKFDLVVPEVVKVNGGWIGQYGTKNWTKQLTTIRLLPELAQLDAAEAVEKHFGR